MKKNKKTVHQEIDELQDFCGPISKLIAILNEVAALYGDVDINVDAAYSNVSFVIEINGENK